MRSAVLRWSSCCRPQPLLLLRQQRNAVYAPSQQLHATGADSPQLSKSCLYVLDLLPLIYRYLPREQLPAGVAPPPPESRLPGTLQQQQQQHVEGPAELFLSSLLTLLKRNVQPPTHMAVTVDVPGATYRHRMYPQYKAHRHQHPPALTEAIGEVLAVLDALGIPVLTVPGVEADDVVGTLAVKAQHDGFGSVVIMSTDKDFFQLLSPKVSVLRGGAYAQPYTLEQFRAEEQLPDPQLWTDIKALMGDVADNIPGIKGIGTKTAKQLVQQFGPVNAIAQRLSSMSEEEQKKVVKLNKKQRALLLSDEGQAAAAFMKELVTINTHLKAPPCQQPWSAYELKLPADGGKRARDWAEKLQFNSLRFLLDEYLNTRLAASA